VMRARCMSKKTIYLEKRVYSLPNLMYELCDSDRTMTPHFVMNLNLAFERFVAQPLRCKKRNYFRTDFMSDFFFHPK
jgi:hypothetical protein